MPEVKGSMLLNVARLIRANKDKDWKKYLSVQDLQIIDGQILPSSWYPLDTYERAEVAIFHEIGKGSLEVAKGWGRFLIEDMVARVYQNLVEDKDPMKALQKFAMFRKQLLRFEDPSFHALECTPQGSRQVRMIVRVDRPTPDFEAHCQQSAGSFERLVELAGGREVQVAILEHDYQGKQPFAAFQISWK